MRPGTRPAGSANRRGRRRRWWARSTVGQEAVPGRPGGGWAASPSAPSRRRPLAVRSKVSLYSALFSPPRFQLCGRPVEVIAVAVTDAVNTVRQRPDTTIGVLPESPIVPAGRDHRGRLTMVNEGHEPHFCGRLFDPDFCSQEMVLTYSCFREATPSRLWRLAWNMRAI